MVAPACLEGDQELLFELQLACFYKLAAEGFTAEAIRFSRSHLTPLTQDQPHLIPRVKVTLPHSHGCNTGNHHRWHLALSQAQVPAGHKNWAGNNVASVKGRYGMQAAVAAAVTAPDEARACLRPAFLAQLAASRMQQALDVRGPLLVQVLRVRLSLSTPSFDCPR